MPTGRNKLTEKQRRWIDYYIETGNATEAARLAGYRAKTDKAMGAIGAENLAKLRPLVDEKLAAKEDVRIAKQDEVLCYLTSVMRGEETEEVVMVVGVGDGCSTARTVVKAVGAKERLKAAELLAKRYGLLTDSVKFQNALPVTIIDDCAESEEPAPEPGEIGFR